MEFSIALFFVVAVILGVAGMLFAFKLTRQRESVFARVASTFGGRIKKGDLFTIPSIRFRHRGAEVLVDVFETGGEDSTIYTQVHLDFPHSGMRLEVYPPTIFTRIGNFLGTEDIEIGSPSFDRDYQISGSNHQAIRQLLSGGVQQKINELRRLTNNDHVYVSVSGGKLLVKKLGLIEHYDPLMRLITLALELYDQALLTQASGIEFVENAGERESWRRVRSESQEGLNSIPQVAPVCQVCGESMATNLVYCRQCKTPHHADCWKYYGACSTYGCREREFSFNTGEPKA